MFSNSGLLQRRRGGIASPLPPNGTGGGLFGAPKPVGVTFGQPAASAGTGLFGQTAAPATGGGLFGQQTPSVGGGLFGTSGATGAFGTPAASTAAGGLFGAQPTATASTAFGAATGGGLFGQQAKPAGGGLFGTTAATGTTNMFGAGAAAAAPGTATKFEPLQASDTMMRNNTQTSIQTKHQCVTSMKVYENKSLEELRVEDYLAGRKGPQAGAPAQAAGGLFGATSSAAPASTSLFGQSAAAKPGGLFGATTTTATTGGLFGQAAPTAGGGLFGAPKPVGTGLFGATSAAPAFGAPATSAAPTGGLFGAKPTGAFGAPAASTGGGLFGTTPAFGAPVSSAATGGLFGAAKPAFGATTTTTASGGLFGAAAPAGGGLFGGAKPAGGGLFGAPASAAPTGGLFGAPAASTAGAFGAPAATGGLFGNTAAKPGGLFGTAAPATGGGLFGSTAPATGAFGAVPAAGGGLFGNTAAKPTLNFGATAQPATGFGGGGLFGATAQPAAAAAPAQLTLNPDAAAKAAFQSQLEFSALSPYGDVLKPLEPLAKDAPKPTDPIAHARIIAASQGNGDSPSGRMRGTGSLFESPRGIGIRSVPAVVASPRILGGLNRSASLRTNTPGSTAHSRSLFAELEADASLMKEGFVPRKNVKKLVLPKRPANASAQGTPSAQRSFPGSGDDVSLIEDEEEPPALLPSDDSVLNSPAPTSAASPAAPKPLRTPVSILKGRLNLNSTTSPGSVGSPTSVLDESLPGVRQRPGRENDDPAPDEDPQRQPTPPPEYAGGLKLTRADYYTVPSLGELEAEADGSVWVSEGFTVGRRGYGSVFWPGHLDLTGLDLDELVHFRHKEVTVYPDEATKAAEGEGLNRPAEVTLEGVWPRDKRTGQPIKDPNRLNAPNVQWRHRLESAAASMGAEFLDFRAESGAWVFRVQHFSKYGLCEDDDQEPLPAQAAGESSPESVQNAVQRSRVPASPPPQALPAHRPSALAEARKWATLGGEEQRSVRMETGSQSSLSASLFASLREGDASAKKARPALPDDARLSALLHSSRSLAHHSSAIDEHSSLMSSALGAPSGSLLSLIRGRGSLLAPSHRRSLAPRDVDGPEATKLSDAALFHGRGMRVGWGPGGRLVESAEDGSFRFRLRSIDAGPSQSPGLDAFLALQQRHAVKTPSGLKDSCPLLSVTEKPELLDSVTGPEGQGSSLWSLLRLLWGQPGEGDGTEARWRKRRLIHWLQEHVQEELRQRKRQADKTSSPYSAVLWEAVLGSASAAAEAALGLGDVRLALLLAAADEAQEASPARQAAQEQIRHWSQYGMEAEMPAGYFELFCALAGRLSFASANGRRFRLCDGLSWRAALLAHLRFGASVEETLVSGVESYEAGVEAGEAAAAEAFEGYAAAEWSLLRLYRDYRSDPAALTEPLAYGPDPLDFRHLWSVWVGLGWVGFSVAGAERQAALHAAFAQQLLHRLRLPRHAIAVLMHINDPVCRRESIREALCGLRGELSPEDEAAVTDLGVPAQWIHAAKVPSLRLSAAALSGDSRRSLELREEEAAALLGAGDADAAHALFLSTIGPTLLINDDYAGLERVLGLLSGSRLKVAGWSRGGGVYADFLRLSALLDSLRQGGQRAQDPKAALVGELGTLVPSMAALPCGTLLERSARTAMVRCLLDVAHAILSAKDLQANARVLGDLAGLGGEAAAPALEKLLARLRTSAASAHSSPTAPPQPPTNWLTRA